MKNQQNGDPPKRMKAKEYSITAKKSAPISFSFTKKKKVKADRSEKKAGKALKKMMNAKSPEKAAKIANRYAKKNY